MTAPFGVLLVNLGTPEQPTTPAVRRYLREFLSDPRVLDLNPVGRALLLNLVILPFRSPRSAQAYASIWTEEGSPLLVQSQRFARAVAERLPDVRVELGMRYGQPSIASALDSLRGAGCGEIVVMPLYPQYAASSTGSTLELVYRLAGAPWNTPSLRVVPPFYDDPGFIEAWGSIAAPLLEDFRPDRVLFSYHGLPERHVRKSDPTGAHCFAHPDHACCHSIVAANRDCYRAQCVATTRALRERLGLDPQQCDIAFQSRLGRTPWIGPFTDHELLRLGREGVGRVAVLCPSFVADCLETLEEIGLRAAADFRAAGGGELLLVHSLNDHPAWIEAAVALLERALPARG